MLWFSNHIDSKSFISTRISVGNAVLRIRLISIENLVALLLRGLWVVGAIVVEVLSREVLG